jgi:uncharacterized protein (UPF0276 family)
VIVPQLTTNLSDALLELLHAGEVPIDAIEVGPWFSVKQIRQYQRQLSSWKFHFHAGSLITRSRVIPGTFMRLRAYLQHTQSPWVSAHISLLPPHTLWLAFRFGWYLPSPDPIQAIKRFIQQVAKTTRVVTLPIILENMPSFPTNRYAFETDPSCITEILQETNCGFLLDTAHARVAAAAHRMDIYDYLDRLPLERVMQIHVSGPRVRNGHLYDAHESLEKVDYTVLEWVLARTGPRAVTLEYFKERETLREQLLCIRDILC